jgi:nicotinamidase/pyrazinamidase
MPLKEHRVQPGPALPLKAGDALLAVDVQADFLAGGSLAVPRGDEVAPVHNVYLALFRLVGLPVLATRDWYPGTQVSFQAQGGPWPPHSVAGTSGARFAPGLRRPADAGVISKATEPQRGAYSAFEGTELDHLLHQAGVGRLFIGGRATDYCVRNTVLDALALGYQTCLLQDAIRAVEVQPGAGLCALAQMLQLGALAVTLQLIRVAA